MDLSFASAGEGQGGNHREEHTAKKCFVAACLAFDSPNSFRQKSEFSVQAVRVLGFGRFSLESEKRPIFTFALHL